MKTQSTLLHFAVFLSACAVFPFAATAEEDELTDLPPAKPGQCFIRTKLPAEYKTVQQKVLFKDASETVEIVPAVYTQIVKRVMVKEAYKEHKITEASFEERDVKVMVRPASTKLVHTPAEMKEIEEEIVVKSARQVWKKGSGAQGKLLHGDASDLLCRVTIPAETKSVKRWVELTPAKTEEIEVPAEYITVKKLVKISPAKVEIVEVPPMYNEENVKILVEPPKRMATPIEPKYVMVDRQVEISPERVGWARVLCDTNLTEPIIIDIQDALKAKEYATGAKRGELDAGLVGSIKKYAEDNNLAKGITYDLLKNLGVKAPEDR